MPPAGGVATRPVRRRAGPFGSDDRVELRLYELVVGTDQIEELLVAATRNVTARVGVGYRAHRASLPAQALMACRSPSPLLTMEILRGLAFSATGILRVSTPAS